MCQNKKDGGKRCQVHQPQVTTMLKHIREELNLPRDQVTAIFQELRQESKMHNVPEDIIHSQLKDALDDYPIQVLEQDHPAVSVITELRDGDYSELDAHSLYALANLREQAIDSAQSLEVLTETIAVRTNATPQSVLEDFNALSRNQEKDQITGAEYLAYRNTALPPDHASISSMKQLVEQSYEGAERSVTLEPVMSHQVDALGFNAGLGRLEVLYKGITEPVSYKKVSQEQYDALITDQASITTYLNDNIRNNPYHLYTTRESADREAYAHKCQTCGQYMNTQHSCPRTEENWKRIDVNDPRQSQRANNIVLLDKLNPHAVDDGHRAVLRDLLHSTYVAVPPRGIVESELSEGAVYSFDSTVHIAQEDEPQVIGKVLVHAQDGAITTDTSQLRCSCGRFVSTMGCNHVMVASAAYMSALDPLNGTSVEQEYFDDHTAALLIEYEDQIKINAIEDSIFYDHLAKGDVISPHKVKELAEERYAEEQALLMDDTLQDLEEELALKEIQDEENDLLYAERAQQGQDIWRTEQESWIHHNQDYYDDRNAYLEHRESVLEHPESGYDGNATRLLDSIAQAQAKKESGQPILEPLTEGVTDGICDPSIPGSRRFGVELEFSFPNNYTEAMRAQKMDLIVRDLRDAGLTSQDKVLPYHTAQATNWGEWSLENDTTTHGELVSPVLADTPEAWAQMGKALEIIKSHGARADQSTGAHVNISTGSYLGSSAKHTELIRIMKQHEAVMYRAAADPKVGSHRQTEFCAPNIAPPRVPIHEFDPSIPEGGMSTESYGRGQAINISNSTLSSQARTEFRLWDGSLDLATLQTQIATSAALVDTAEMNVEEEGVSRPREAVESLHVQETAYQSNLSEVSGKSLYNLSDFVDTVFRKQRDRERFVSLFAVNEWVTKY